MPPNQQWYCSFQMFILHFSTLCSNYLLIAMTFERFYSIIRPHMAASFNTVKKARIIVVSVFLGLSSYCTPYLFITVTSGRICVSNQNASENVFRELYYWLTEVLSFMFPFVSLVTMNSFIIHILQQRSKLQFSESAGQGQGQTEGQHLKIKQSEKQIFTLVLLITFVFLTLNIPTRILVFYMNFYSGNTAYYYAGLHLFFQVGEATYIANHGINFFLYVVSGQKFKTDLRNLFISMRSKNVEFLVSNVNTVSNVLSSDDK